MVSLAPSRTVRRPAPLAALAAGPLLLGGRLLRTWWERYQARQQLRALDDRLLRDVGLTRDAVEREWQKGFWQA